MPDLATYFGIAQSLGFAIGLLLFLALRARRYHTSLPRTYIPLWLLACIGLTIYSMAERHVEPERLVLLIPLIFALPAAASLLLGRFVGKQ
jgi:drug/metabolite transporter (DMT)-like permease